METYINILLWVTLYLVSVIILVLVRPNIFDTKDVDYAEFYEILLFILLPIIALVNGVKYWRQPK